MQGRITNDKYEAEVERYLNEMINNQSEKVAQEYDAIREEILAEVRPLFHQWQGQAFTKTKRQQIQNTIQRIINDHHKRIRKEVQKTSNNAAVIGYSGVQYQTEMKDRIKLPVAVMLLSALNKDYKKSRVHNDYTAKKLSDGKNYADRLRRNHGKLIRQLTNDVGTSINKVQAVVSDLENAIARSVEKVEKRTKAIMEMESKRVEEEAAAEAVKEMEKIGIKKTKTWESRGDSRVRDTHRRLHGTTLVANAFFESSGHFAEGPRQFGVPAEDARCRCRLHWDTVEIDEAKLEMTTREVIEEEIAYAKWKEENGYWY